MAVDSTDSTQRPRLKLAAGIGIAAAILLIVFFTVVRPRLARPDVHYDAVPVQRGKLIAKVTATGTLNARVTVQVGAQVSGRIAQLMVDFNSPVNKGQVIAKIDPQLFEAALQQARANYVEAEANLSKAKVQALDAKRQYDRAKGLKDRGLVSQAEVDTAETNWLAGKAQVEVSAGAVEQARASRDQAKINLDYTTIYSPISGVVISRNVDVGQTVASALQAPTLFTIAEDLKTMQVHTNVAEADVGKLAEKMIAAFTVDAFPNEVFRGIIHEIRNAAQTVQNVVTYDAVIDVQNPELKLRPGMTANVTVIYAEKDDVLKIPNAALRFKPGPEVAAQTSGPSSEQSARPARPMLGQGQGKPPGAQGPDALAGAKAVWVLGNPSLKRVPVQTGLSDGTVSELVSSNLHEGDRVVVGSTGGDIPKGPPSGARRIF
jgi:HlyD family secretion protein